MNARVERLIKQKPNLDGNQLFFNYPSEAASATIAGDEGTV
jgi:hypothetical protein